MSFYIGVRKVKQICPRTTYAAVSSQEPEFIPEEIQIVIKWLKNNKTIGIDSISNVQIKASGRGL